MENEAGSDRTVTSDEAVDPELESKESALRRYFMTEWEDVKRIIAGIVSSNGVADPADVKKICYIMGKYQEEGQLLEPYIEAIITPLMSVVRSTSIRLLNQPDQLLDIIKPICIMIYSLVTVSGYKSVVRFFPHQVSDLELAVSLMEISHKIPKSEQSTGNGNGSGEMETKCVVLLWLYVLVLIPFDISTVDSSIGFGADLDGGNIPLVERILEMSKDYLANAGPMRSISGLLLARLLTRPDMSNTFDSFMSWSHDVLLSVKDDDFEDEFRSLGLVEALASIFKIGSRSVLFNAVSSTWDDISFLMKSKLANRNSLLRKLLVKLAQRVGLICLAPRPHSWQYKPKSSSLRANLSGAKEEGPFHNLDKQSGPDEKTDADSEEEDIDVPEPVEEILDLLLTGLRDSNTIVRWSAAKGIGRITARLTSSLSEEVLSSILQLFSPGEGEGSWHGGCVAIAELARRGILLPVSFPKVIPVITQALHYDIRRGANSVGTAVRDAAAYVCWAFGRAYSDRDMKGVLEQLAPHLLRVACYDREVNCRRAASAAFQENVGRQGDFPHGIEIVNMADYFALSSRSNSYLQVAVSISGYKEYLRPFVDELLFSKINHWEKGLRELAAEGLSALAKYEPDYFGDYVINEIIPLTLSQDLCTRHGAILAAAELALTLHNLGFIFPSEKQKALSGLVPAIEKARLYRGKGGEIMRLAVSRFIECISIAKISLNEKIKKSLLDTLNENIKHPNEQIQCAAVDALKQFFPTYFSSCDDKTAQQIVSNYVKLLDDPNVAARRGAALALGILPFNFLSLSWNLVISKLCNSCTGENKPDDPDVESRVNATKALISVCETLANPKSLNQTLIDPNPLYSLIKTKVFSALFKALEDYAVDNRGDIGSWVRQASMLALEKCTFILCKKRDMFDNEIGNRLVGGLLKQAVEKLDKMRDFAAKTLRRILYCRDPFVEFMPFREVLEEIVPDDPQIEWNVATVSYPRLVKLLSVSCYSEYVLSGLVISSGGLQESLQKTSLNALEEFLKASGKADERESRERKLSADFLWILKRYLKLDRVIVPTFKTIEVLLSKRFFLNMEGQTEELFSGLLDSLSIELRASKNFTKLNTGISILECISSQTMETNSKAFSFLLSFLGHQYPNIRKSAADKVFLVLEEKGDVFSSEKKDKAIEVVIETPWDGDDLEMVKIKRLELFEILELDASICQSKASRVRRKAEASMKASKNDENTSYSSLVDFSGF
ncbi:hypothetical protein LUZ60_014764 [Juncus effusus]|nr:hypothetical protein LUZ60_014764 [Juncus effusus]